MFSFLYSEQKKMRQNAANWLEMAERVYHYRRDQLTEPQTRKLLAAIGEVKLRLKERADRSRIKQAAELLEAVLRDTGGRVYPVSSWVENVEFFLGAAILILGLRAYFLQPFKIPTNSMWPTYYGMTSEVFPAGKEPGMLGKVARLLTLGATNYSVTAPADGEVLIPVFSDLRPAFTEKAGRSLLIFPASMREYTFSVGGEMVRLTVPAEWAQSGSFDEVVHEAFFKDRPGTVYAAIRDAAAKAEASRGQSLEQSTVVVHQGDRSGEARVYWVPVGRKVTRGDKLLSFDILTGDLLFVDRFSYNFFPPKVGSGFVFKTVNIHSPEMADYSGNQIDQYYIKRLVGGPGDKLEVRRPAPLASDDSPPLKGKDGQLFRNGRPIDGAAAFGRNSRKDGLYPGYTADGSLAFGQVVSVPNNSYFAMGDNSPRSKDSRYWGFVPDKDVVGRPLFIYYPLTSRWGPAK
jgi:signal peptidase I